MTVELDTLSSSPLCRMGAIYTLTDPRDHAVRYVGQALNTGKRLACHLASAGKRSTHVSRWIAKLVRMGLKPYLQVAQMLPVGCLDDAEVYWIAHFRLRGCQLTNAALGGRVNRGHSVSAQGRAKMSAAWKLRRLKPNPRKGTRLSSEAVEKIRQSAIRQFSNPANRLRVSAVHKGKKLSVEHVAVLSAVTTQRWVDWRASGSFTSDETRRKISEARKGKPLSEAHRQALSCAGKGVPKSPEHRERLAIHLRRVVKEREAKRRLAKEAGHD